MADSCEMMLRDTKLPEIMAKEKPGLYKQIREWIANFAEKLRKAFTGVEARHEEARAMMQYAEEMQQIWDNALAGAVRNTEAATENGTAAPNNKTNDGLFAETAKFSNRQREEDTIKRQIKDNLEELNDMEPVASIYDSLDMGKDKGQYRKWIVDKLASTGYQVDRKGFGKITFTPKQLNAGINYVNEPAEMAAFLTIPKVLKQGAEIREHDNHKERNVETITFSAPVEINGTRGNVAVVVKLTKNYFKALRILTPEGKVYSLSGYEKTELTPTQHTPTSGAESASISSVNNTIPQASEESNTKYSMRERDDRQEAIQRELNQLKGEKKDLLNANAEYAAAVEQRRYAETFTERVAASKALKAAEAKVDTAEIDARIEMLQNESAELREQERAEYNAAKEKYSGAKTKGYSQYADTRTRELDEEYSRAVTARDETKMQELVLEAAERAMPNSVIRDENGKLKPVYHYTNNDFTVFDRSRARTGNEMDGFFFAPDPESTTEYGERRVTAFLNITNPAYDPYLDRKHNDSGTLLREKLAYEGYDGVIRTEDGKAYEYMAFDPEQIKSAEAITYDDAGNVIPLSERFNSRSNDIRYSMRDVAADDTADERRGRGAWIKILKHIFKHHASACCFFYVFFYVYLAKSMTDSAARQGDGI